MVSHLDKQFIKTKYLVMSHMFYKNCNYKIDVIEILGLIGKNVDI